MTRNTVAALFLFMTFLSSAQVIPVEVIETASGWQFIREGKSYYVKGAGGHAHMDVVVACGGNSIRTWGLENAQEILDEAHSHGLTVMLGLWVQHERHGFDYDDPVAVRKQLEGFRTAVKKYKDHPALLLWGVGNEVDLFYKNTKVWDAVEDIAAMIKELDPHHPTSTVTAGLDPAEVALIKEKAPSIDVYGINTYGDIGKVDPNIEQWGWDGPYMITEWGVNGHWESPTTDFGVPIEQTSHQKAKSFDERYSMIENDSRQCLGSYAFLWGSKQETTSTWYGLFTPEGHTSEAVDVLAKRWGGNDANKAPVLKDLVIGEKSLGATVFLTAEDRFQARVEVSDPDGDALTYHWSIIPESTDKRAGGDAEAAPKEVRGSAKMTRRPDYVSRIPSEEGPYRLFVFVRDGQGQAGTANFPFYVMPRSDDAEQSRAVRFKTQTLDIPDRKR